MNTKSPDLWNRLPTVAKLLEQPQLRKVADRLNRSAVANGVRSFLIEVKDDLQRRASEIQLPSLNELAERAARHVARYQESSCPPTINATGRLLDSAFTSPIATEAIDQIVASTSGFCASHRAAVDPRSDFTALEARICRLTGAESALVVHNYAGAIWLTLAATAAGRETAISRSDVGDVDPNCSIATLFESSGTTLKEIGAVNSVTAAEYEHAITEDTAAICKHVSDHYRIAGLSSAPDFGELVGLARDRDLTLIHAIGAAPLIDNLPAMHGIATSIAASVAAGAHVTIARGDGLVGGPRCGIILGIHEHVQTIKSHSHFARWQAEPLVMQTLETTLRLYDDVKSVEMSLPIFQLLATPAENLLDRAERLAPQFARATDVENAEVVAIASGFGIERYANCVFLSHGIALTAANGDVASLDERLRRAPMPVIGRRENGRLVLDLRTVFPREDQRLIATVVDCRAAENRNEVAAVPAVPSA